MIIFHGTAIFPPAASPYWVGGEVQERRTASRRML